MAGAVSVLGGAQPGGDSSLAGGDGLAVEWLQEPSGKRWQHCSSSRNGPCAAGAVGRPDLCRRAIGNAPGAQEPGSFGRVDAVEAALRGCLGPPPVS